MTPAPSWDLFVYGLITGAVACGGIMSMCVMQNLNDRKGKEMVDKERKKRIPIEEVYEIFDVRYPILKIPTEKEGDRFPIGLRKSKAILEHLEAIRAFVAKHDRENGTKPVAKNDP
jgi:hypothetical protein